MKKSEIIKFFILLLCGAIVIMLTRYSDYKRDKEFYKNNFSSIVSKITESRKDKVYYNNSMDYFHLNNYNGDLIQKNDSIIKDGKDIYIYRNGISIGTGSIKKPNNNLILYCLNLP